MTIYARLVSEAGAREAMVGLSLSYNTAKGYDQMLAVAEKLAHKGDGHNKFLEAMVMWWDITAPMYWWKQFDTYRVGVTKQSESTMHTLLKRQLDMDDFAVGTPEESIAPVNERIRVRDMVGAQAALPGGFLQRRVVCMNYMALQRMAKQRYEHELGEWREFCDAALRSVQFPQFIMRGGEAG